MMKCCSSDRALAVTNGHPTCYINTFKTISEMVLDAAKTGNVGAIQKALEFNFMAEYVYALYLELCCICIENNQTECLKLLASLNGELKKEESEFDPVQVAVMENKLEYLKLLVSAGFKLKMGEYGHLWIAQFLGRTECEEYLMMQGCTSTEWISMERSFDLPDPVQDRSTEKATCPICVKNNTLTYKCDSCNNIACKSCIAKYFKSKELKCMHCGVEYNYIDMHNLPGTKTFLAKEYKKIIADRLFDETPRPSDETIEENAQEIRRLIGQHGAKSVIAFEQRLKLFYVVDSCKRVSCTGRLVEGMCNVCSFKHCDNCGEYIASKHECNANSVKTHTLLKRDSVPCPRCSIRISKVEGCNDMFCTYCNAKFSYRTGEFRVNGHNPHQAQHEAARVNNQHPNLTVHNKIVQISHRMHVVKGKIAKVPKFAQYGVTLEPYLKHMERIYQKILLQPTHSKAEVFGTLRNRYIACYVSKVNYKKDLVDTELAYEYIDMKNTRILPIWQRLVEMFELYQLDMTSNRLFNPQVYIAAFERDLALFDTELFRLHSIYGKNGRMDMPKCTRETIMDIKLKNSIRT